MNTRADRGIPVGPSAPPPKTAWLSGECLQLDIQGENWAGQIPRTLSVLGGVWAIGGYREAHPPIEVGKVEDGWNHLGLPCVLDLCIRVPKGPILLPVELGQVRGIVERFLAVTAPFDEKFHQEGYLYLTCDQRYVAEGLSHRDGGFHADGLQGVRYTDKLPICYQGIVADSFPTVFACQKFDLEGLDLAREDAFRAMDAQVRPECLREARANVLTVMNAYSVHTSPVVTKSGWRTFVRVEVSRKRFDRAGNTVHPLLSGDWGWVDRFKPRWDYLPSVGLVDV